MAFNWNSLKDPTTIKATIASTLIASIVATGITLNSGGQFNVTAGVNWIAAYNGTEWLGYNGSVMTANPVGGTILKHNSTTAWTCADGANCVGAGTVTLSSVDPTISTTGTGSDMTFKSNTAIDGTGPDFRFCSTLNRNAGTNVFQVADNNCGDALMTVNSDGDVTAARKVVVSGAVGSLDVNPRDGTGFIGYVYNPTGDNLKLGCNGDLITAACTTGDVTVAGGLTVTGVAAGAGKAACLKTNGVLGYCSSVVGADGTCTCN